MNTSTLKAKALGLFVGILSTISSAAQFHPPTIMTKDPIKYALMHSDFGASGLHLPGKKYSYFAEGELRGYMYDLAMGVRRNFKNASATLGYAKDWPEANSYGFVSGEYLPKMGRAKIHPDFRVTLSRFLGKNDVSKNNAAVSGYGGLIAYSNKKPSFYYSSGLGVNNFGVTEISANVTHVRPIRGHYSRNAYGQSVPGPGVYMGVGGTSILRTPEKHAPRCSAVFKFGMNF